MQLDLKTVGWGPANRPTNRRTELFADWIEAQAFLAGVGNSISKHELVDRLELTSLVVDSDDAWTLVGDAFSACRNRRRQMGESYPFAIAGDAFELDHEDRHAYLFCLLVSLPEQLQVLRTAYSTEFRDIFERIVFEAVRAAMPNWQVYMTGWSTIAEEAGKGAIVDQIAKWVLAKIQDKSVFADANDGQVDIAAVRPFGDARSAFPVLLGQCATGVTDWKSKASRPNLDRWRIALQFTCHPTKLFAVPFSLDDKSFWEATVESAGLVLDRSRICRALPTVSADLERALRDWMEKARQVLPLAA